MTIKVELPEKLQFLFEPARYKVAWGGRGSGKSWSFARALLLIAASRKVRILCAREIQKSIKDSVHRLLSDQIIAMGLSKQFEVLETMVRGRNGSEILFSGLSGVTTDSIKSFEGVDYCWVEEGQTISKRSWDVLIPTIRKAGSEIWISMNPELDTDETYVRFIKSPPPSAIVVCMNYDDNPWFGGELEEERQHAKKTMLPEDYANIWEGKARKTAVGAIYAKEIERMEEERRLRPVPYDPMLNVHCIWDLGWNDAMTIILVQRSASELRVIDYIEDSHQTLDWYVAKLKERQYNWGKDFIPHDGRHRDFKTGKSTEDILTALGRKVEITPGMSIEEGIKAARLIFGRTYFDETKAGRLVECLRRYRRAINERTQEPGAPVHDEFSHGADAYRYLGIVADTLTNERDGMSHPIFYDPRFSAGRAPATSAGY